MDLGIAGVIARDLRIVRNARGIVREIVRADDADFPGFGQVHVVETRPGIVRAWFRHRLQTDQICCIRGRCRLGLFDDRPGSPTRGAFADLVLDGDVPLLVSLPPMVWHGFATLGAEASILVQHNSEAFDHGAPDEEKRPFDAPGFPIAWRDA